MAVVVPLDSRQASITRILLTETGPSTVEAVASELKLTSRVVRYNLPSIETFLRPEGLHVTRRGGVGVWVSGDEERVPCACDPIPAAKDLRRTRLRAG